MIDPLESTPAGRIRAKLRVRDSAPTVAEVDRLLDLADEDMVQRRGRHFTAEERSLAERQIVLAGPGLWVPPIGVQECLDLGWGVSVPGRRDGAGVAVRQADGSWAGDPEVAATVEAYEVRRRVLLGDLDLLPDGPGIRGVPGAS
jgi:hypothetical protein